MLHKEFQGVARLFPLPDFVMFPHVVQPLYVFEPRYVEMLETALEGDQLLALGLLKAGWEADYQGEPPIHSTVCVARIISHSQRANGHYNILVAGMNRAKIVKEIDNGLLFREAEVELIPDDAEISSDIGFGLQTVLAKKFRELVPDSPTADEVMSRIMHDDTSLGMLADLIAFSLPIQLEVKQELLSELNIEKRAQYLIDHLSSHEADAPFFSPDRHFPPDFSHN